MYDLDQSPEHYRRREAEAREAAAQARSHTTRQIQLELAEIYRSRAEQAQARNDQSRAVKELEHSSAS